MSERSDRSSISRVISVTTTCRKAGTRAVMPFYFSNGFFSFSVWCVCVCERERERENSNSKTLFYKDCSLGSFKNLS